MNNMTIEEFIKEAELLGFKLALSEDFKDNYGQDNKLILMWHQDGILITADTYCYSLGKRILNSAAMYYNIMLLAPVNEWFSSGALSSGYIYFNGPITDDNSNSTNIWIGYHRIERGNLDYLINHRLRNLGLFLKNWVDSSQVFIHTYVDPIRDIKDVDKFSSLIRTKTINYFKQMPIEIGDMLISAYRRKI